MTAVVRAEPIPMTTRHDGVALRSRLTMLGWQVEIEQDGELYVGVARHVTAEGDTLTVGGCAATTSETVWQLFESVMGRLSADDTGRDTLRRRAGQVAA
jgi:hypothetical protein